MYSFDSRIRFSEVDSDSKLMLNTLLDYFQDCSTFQSEDLGLGVGYCRQLNLVWLMSYWQIDIVELPKLGDRVKIGTFPYEFKGCFGFRNFFMENEKQEKLAVANSLWTLMDTEKMVPGRPTEEMKIGYAIEEKLDMEYLPRKIKFEGEYEILEPVEVKEMHLDSNMHVNNGQYVRIACEYLPKGFPVKRLRASYHKSALLGDKMYPYIYSQKENTFGIALCQEDGTVYANVEFSH